MIFVSKNRYTNLVANLFCFSFGQLVYMVYGSYVSIQTRDTLMVAKLAGVFLAVSSNTRYQIVNGLEHLVEGSLMAKQFPPVPPAFTVGMQFANNVPNFSYFIIVRSFRRKQISKKLKLLKQVLILFLYTYHSRVSISFILCMLNICNFMICILNTRFYGLISY